MSWVGLPVVRQQYEKQVISDSVHVVLNDTSDGHGKRILTNEFVEAVTNMIRASGITNIFGDRIE